MTIHVQFCHTVLQNSKDLLVGYRNEHFKKEEKETFST